MKKAFDKEAFNTALGNLKTDLNSELYISQVHNAVIAAQKSVRKSLMLEALAVYRQACKQKQNTSETLGDLCANGSFLALQRVFPDDEIAEILDIHIDGIKTELPDSPTAVLGVYLLYPPSHRENRIEAQDFAIKKIVEGELTISDAIVYLKHLIGGQPGMAALRWKRFYTKLEAAQKAKAETDAAAKPELV